MESGTPGLKATAERLDEPRVAREAEGKFPPSAPWRWAPVLPRALRGGSPPSRSRPSAGFPGARRRGRPSEFEESTRRAGSRCCRPPAAKPSKPSPCCNPSRSSLTCPHAGADYPRGRFGDCLRQIAQLIKADVGVEMAFADVGGWDHHVNEVGQRASQGQLANLLANSARRSPPSGATWATAWPTSRWSPCPNSAAPRAKTATAAPTTATPTACSRWAAGSAAARSTAVGPAWQPEQLYEARDLALTTDFRDVLGELVARHMGNPALANIFPSYTP